MILITGHLGFIGSHLAEYLKENKIEAIGYDINSFQSSDIRDRFKLEKVFAENNIDCVIHLAARAGVRMGEEYPEEFLSTNVLGSKNVLDMCEKYKVNKVILFSSSSVYGYNNIPVSFYGMTKKMMEDLSNLYDIPSIFIVRPFTVYGENGRKDQVIFKWINQIKAGKPITFYGDGSISRWYTYVGDLINGVKLMIDSKKTGKTNVDLAGDRRIKLDYLLDIFIFVLNDIKVNKLPLPDVDDVYNVPMGNDIGYEPKQNFEEKVKEIIKKELNL